MPCQVLRRYWTSNSRKYVRSIYMHILLSCISTKHSMLKKHWKNSQEDREKTECPLTVLGSQQKLKEDQGGLLCVLNGGPSPLSSLELAMPAGMAPTDEGFLVAALDTIHEVKHDLSTVKRDVVSL